MRVFLDIGASNGAITTAALTTGRFDRAYCFEPQPSECDTIRALQDDRIVVCPFALGATTGRATIYRGRTMGSASLYATKRFHGRVREAPCDVVSASQWFREHLTDEDWVVAKANCEGSEVDILEDLAASGEIRKLSGLAVIFDIRKVPPERHREAQGRALLTRIPKTVVMPEAICGLPHLWLPYVL